MTATVTTPPAAVNGSKLLRRDTALDAIRGLCVISMAVGHLAPGTLLSAMTHPSPWLDSAFGFILVSGLLVGIVQRSSTERLGQRGADLKILRRTRVVFASHVALALLGLAVVASSEADVLGMTAPSGARGWLAGVFEVLTLQQSPLIASVLRTYVVFMLLTPLAVRLLRRNRSVALAAVSVGLYAAAQLRPGLATFDGGGEGGWSLAAWQAVFFGGVACGWYWREDGVRASLSSRWLLVTVVTVTAVGLILSRTVWLVPWPGQGYALIAKMSSKDTVAPVRFALSLATVVLLYLAFTRLRQHVAHRATGPVVLIGQRALDAYLILGACAIVAPIFEDEMGKNWRTMILAAAVVVVCWLWAGLRARWAQRKSSMTPAAPPSRPIPPSVGA